MEKDIMEIINERRKIREQLKCDVCGTTGNWIAIKTLQIPRDRKHVVSYLRCNTCSHMTSIKFLK